MDRSFLCEVAYKKNSTVNFLKVCSCSELFDQVAVKCVGLDDAEKIAASTSSDFRIENGSIFGGDISTVWDDSDMRLPLVVYEPGREIYTLIKFLKHCVKNNVCFVSEKVYDRTKEGKYTGGGVVLANKLRVSNSTMTISFSSFVDGRWGSDVILSCKKELEVLPFNVAYEAGDKLEDRCYDVHDCEINGKVLRVGKVKELSIYNHMQYEAPILGPFVNRLSFDVTSNRSTIRVMKDVLLDHGMIKEFDRDTDQPHYPAREMLSPTVYVKNVTYNRNSVRADVASKYALKVCEALNWDVGNVNSVYNEAAKLDGEMFFCRTVSLLACCLLNTKEPCVLDEYAGNAIMNFVDNLYTSSAMMDLSMYEYRLSLLKFVPSYLRTHEVVCTGGGVTCETILGARRL